MDLDTRWPPGSGQSLYYMLYIHIKYLLKNAAFNQSGHGGKRPPPLILKLSIKKLFYIDSDWLRSRVIKAIFAIFWILIFFQKI